MSRINSARLRKLETHRARLRDVSKLSDEELNALIAEELGISPDKVAAMSDEELELIAGKRGNERK